MGYSKKKNTNATKVSKRRLKKQIKKANKSPDRNVHTISVNKKMTKELSKTSEGKAYNNLLTQYTKAATVSRSNRVLVDRNTALIMTSIQDAYVKKGQELYKKYQDQYASAMLRDLGYDDTSDGREYLKRLGIV